MWIERFNAADVAGLHETRPLLPRMSLSLLICLWVSTTVIWCNAEESRKWEGLTVYGVMHEAIGKGQHQRRVNLSEITGKPHFYGVGALEELLGEITILDSTAVMTAVTREGRPQAIVNPAAKATLMVGQSVAQWREFTLKEEISWERFDQAIGTMATTQGVNISKPFVFVVEGEFQDVRLHVINGACPLHARMRKIEIQGEKRPFEFEASRLSGTLVGVHAVDAVGKLTHPGTTTHAHLIFLDETTGERVTGHLEQVGLIAGAVVRLPDDGEQDGPVDGSEPSPLE